MKGIILFLIISLLLVLSFPVTEFYLSKTGSNLLSIYETPQTVTHTSQLKGGEPFTTIEPVAIFEDEDVLFTSCKYLEDNGHLVCGIIQRPFTNNYYSFLPNDNKVSMTSNSFYFFRIESFNFFNVELPYTLEVYNEDQLVEVLEISIK